MQRNNYRFLHGGNSTIYGHNSQFCEYCAQECEVASKNINNTFPNSTTFGNINNRTYNYKGLSSGDYIPKYEPFEPTVADSQMIVIDKYADLKKNLYNYDIETSKDEKKANNGEFKKYNKNVNNYDIETAEYIKHGIKVFQNYLLSDDEKQHVKLIYDILKPKSGSTIVDMGCGIGEVGYQFKKIDPTLKIIGITNSQSQYEIAKDKIIVFLQDYHYIPLKSNSVDIVTFMESIGHGNLKQLFKEVYRVLKPGGILFIKDFFSNGYTMHNKNWDYTFNYIGDFKNIIKEFKFKILQEIELPDNPINKRKYSNFVNSNDIMLKYHGYLYENRPTYPYIFVLEKNF